MVGHDHAKQLVRMAKKQDKLELEWVEYTRKWLDEVNEMVARKLLDGQSIKDIDFTELFMEHYFSVTKAAIEMVETEKEIVTKEKPKRLTYSPVKVPRTLRDLQKMYDDYRKKRTIPKRQQELANRVKKQYLKKVQDVWRKVGEEFRSGGVFDQKEVVKTIRKATDGVYSRSKTIVETETTNYYNKVRKEIYDEADGVSHYLFLAIRDQKTSQWCSDKTTKGKRGRHGLVYKKGDELTNKETPAIHGNCRSEMVPLSPYNPRHRQLINNPSLHRRNVACTPLPKGWE